MVVAATTAAHLTVARRIIAAWGRSGAIHPPAGVRATGGVGYRPTAVFLAPSPAGVGLLAPSFPVVAGLIVVVVVPCVVVLSPAAIAAARLITVDRHNTAVAVLVLLLLLLLLSLRLLDVILMCCCGRVGLLL